MTLLVLATMFLATGLFSTAQAFDLQGHRGARGLMPENTLPAFEKALTIGVTTLELDTGITKDGVVVVSHDPALNPDITRGKDGKWLTDRPLIKELTLQKLKSYDVGSIRPGSRTAKRFSSQTQMDGVSIPTLEELFQLVAKTRDKNIRFNIETKINPMDPEATVPPETFANALIALVRQYKLQNRVTIQSFDWRTLQIVQEIEPSIDTAYLTAQQDWMDNLKSNNDTLSIWTAGFNLDDHNGSAAELVKAAGGAVWSPFFRDLDTKKVQTAQSLGLKVIPWTINDAATMEYMIDIGVDGIITDYPNILRNVMEMRSLNLPPAIKSSQ